MSDIEEPGYAEVDDDEFSEPTGGGVGFDEVDDDAEGGEDEDFDFSDEDDDAA